MPELRQNIITRDWVIISTERAKRPDQFAKEIRQTETLPARDAQCPFCPGNEEMSGGEVIRYPPTGDWSVRIVPNKYPALITAGNVERKIDGIKRSMNAYGRHEVIIEDPRHNVIFTDLSEPETACIIEQYALRYRQIAEDKLIKSIIIFRNHGKKAGTSLVHPHSQIAATPVVPFQLRVRQDIARSYYDDEGECVFCKTMREELADGRRVVLESPHFVSFIPYAALSPFHIWIFPKRHCTSFDEISREEISDLSVNLRAVLRKLHAGLNNPDFNFTIRSIATDERHLDYYHWYLAVVPRLSIQAGFELGSGMYISAAIPEESAEFLRNVHPA